MAENLRLDQYDDLTVGLYDFDEDLYVDDSDLLRYQEPESPLAKLKSLVVSIDWEITDEVLLQFNEEILHLRNTWADTKIYVVYLQALEQISKYIYQEKSNAHPNAIKLLPLFFQNLERIAASSEMTEDEKLSILAGDVKRFNKLKKDITAQHKVKMAAKSGDAKGELQELKALVLGIDWEVTEKDLGDLRREVMSLENLYQNSKPRLLLLQGIGTLSAYIQHKGSNANAGAFTLLHDFFARLEQLVSANGSFEDEKKAVLGEVEKFNAFKKRIANTLSPESLRQDDEDRDEQEGLSGTIIPAFSDMDPVVAKGFQEDEVASSMGGTRDISEKLGTFFPDEVELKRDTEDKNNKIELAATPADTDVDVSGEADSRLDDFFAEPVSHEDFAIDSDLALRGVAVETEADDDSDEEALARRDGELMPALSGDDGEVGGAFDETPVVASTVAVGAAGAASVAAATLMAEDEKAPAMESQVQDASDVASEADSRLDDFFAELVSSEDTFAVDSDLALRGVAVETEADDDSDEEALARRDGELMPALSDDAGDEELTVPSFDADFAEDELEDESPAQLAPVAGPAALAPALSFDADEDEFRGQSVSDASDAMDESSIASRLDDFFGSDDDFAVDAAEEDAPAEFASQDTVAAIGGAPALTPALSFEDDEDEFREQSPASDTSDAMDESLIESRLDDFFGSDDGMADVSAPSSNALEEGEREITINDFFDETEKDEPLSPVFMDDSLPEEPNEDVIMSHLDDFFGEISEDENGEEHGFAPVAMAGGVAGASLTAANFSGAEGEEIDDDLIFTEVDDDTPLDYEDTTQNSDIIAENVTPTVTEESYQALLSEVVALKTELQGLHLAFKEEIAQLRKDLLSKNE